jgi:hypothetical protein
MEKIGMQLWSEWWMWVEPLRDVCPRVQTFLWLISALAGISTRRDLSGVTSIVRALGLNERYYNHLLDFFNSNAIDPDKLSRRWVQILFTRLKGIVRFKNLPVLLGDGIKIPKRGRKMPGVKSLHQSSDGNTKPEYIMGHSIQVVSLLVAAAGTFFAIPLAGRIHEGLIFSNRDQRTIQDKFVLLAEALGIKGGFYMVADAYYSCKDVILGLHAQSSHLISRVRKNTVAYELVHAISSEKRKRGRPKIFGNKIRLSDLFEDMGSNTWIEALSPVYGESGVNIKFLCLDLIWRPVKYVVRFILVVHPTRGRCILLCTDLTANPIDVIRLYGLRFKIEVSFKQAVHIIGVYTYHFWMMAMDKIGRRSGDQYLHHKSPEYRADVRRKQATYHRYIQVSIIAQGILQCLSITIPEIIWKSFGSWLRTIRPGIPPSELVTMSALKNTLPEFIIESGPAPLFRKFLRQRIDPDRAEGLRLSG